MPTVSQLKEQILKDRRVNKDEAYQLIEEVMRGHVTQHERSELHGMLIDYGEYLEPGARKELEKALGIASKQKLARVGPVRDEADLKPLHDTLALVEKVGKACLFELTIAEQKANPAFVKLSPALKTFVQAGKSSLTPKEAMALASGFSAGKYHDVETDALFHPGDRLAVTVHYPNGATQDTNGLVVSAGASPLVLVVNKNGLYQMIRQEPKSREQLTVTAFVAGAA